MNSHGDGYPKIVAREALVDAIVRLCRVFYGQVARSRRHLIVGTVEVQLNTIFLPFVSGIIIKE